MEQNERSRSLLGAEALEKLKHCRIILFGVGGVGGQIAECLGRMGIGHLTLVDPDCVSLTNLNRQIIALHSTLGRKKVDVMAERLKDINPHVDVTLLPLFFGPEQIDEINFADYDYIIDAIDTLSGKLALVTAARAVNRPLIAAMGAGNRKDPGGFVIADLAKTEGCPLARSYRRECRKLGVTHLTVAYSKEAAMTPVAGAETETKETGRPVCGSLPWTPAAMGLLMAAKVVDDLICDCGVVPN